MNKKHESSSANRSKAPVGWGAGHGSTPGGSQAVPSVVPTVPLPTHVVLRFFNELKALVPTHGGLP
ncbi:hypothetical protein HAX54_048928, partial [Datura stramonium]|nr:hypothetical protein [Datura stramonium]